LKEWLFISTARETLHQRLVREKPNASQTKKGKRKRIFARVPSSLVKAAPHVQQYFASLEIDGSIRILGVNPVHFPTILFVDA